jgi:2-polyprenyl-3-methyl-5-hydroxy-6-metoxy-1,4-benzoquinol methylase
VDGEGSRYAVDIDLANPNTSHSIVVDLVDRGKRVLDLGCWTGDLGRALIERGCRVSGLEVDEVAAARAQPDLDTVVVADLDTSPASEHFPAGGFDVVVLADVLEHVRHPAAVLSDAATLLEPEGRIVASIPNVTHGSVRLALLQGRWSYTETGLLDAGHLHFYNRAAVLALFADAGLVVEELHGTIADPLEVEVVVAADRLPPSMIEWVRQQRDALVYQFVVSARLARSGETAAPAEVPLVPAVPEESVRRVDKFTERSAAELESRQQQLNVRDHIIGLEAATVTAQSRASRISAQLDVANKRLARKNDRIKELADQVRALKQEPSADSESSGGSGLGRLRRGRTS